MYSLDLDVSSFDQVFFILDLNTPSLYLVIKESLKSLADDVQLVFHTF